MFRPEQLHSQMLVVPCVEKDSVFLLSGESDCDVGGGSDVEGLQLHVGGVGVEAEGGQILASLAGVPRGTLAHVVVGPRRLKSNQLQEATESFAFPNKINESEDAFIDELLFNIWYS